MQKLGLTTLASALLASGQLAPEGMGMPSRRQKKPKEFTEFDQERLDAAEAKRDRKHPSRTANFYVPPGSGGSGHAAKPEPDPSSISSIKLKHRVHRGAARLIKASNGDAA